MRVAGRSEGGILVGRAERKLVQVGFADEDRAGLTQMGDGRRIALGDVAVAHPRGSGRRHPADVEQILDGDGHAVQRPAIDSGGQLAVRCGRLCACFVRHHADEGVELAVVGLDAVQALLGDRCAVTSPARSFRPNDFKGQGVGGVRHRRGR